MSTFGGRNESENKNRYLSQYLINFMKYISREIFHIVTLFIGNLAYDGESKESVRTFYELQR